MILLKKSISQEEIQPIPVERGIQTSFLILNGTDDRVIDPDWSQEITIRIRGSNNEKCRLISFEGAGHLLDSPFMPMCRFMFDPKWAMVDYGGMVHLHAKAQEQAWKHILEFLNGIFTNNHYKRVGRLPKSHM